MVSVRVFLQSDKRNQQGFFSLEWRALVSKIRLNA